MKITQFYSKRWNINCAAYENESLYDSCSPRQAQNLVVSLSVTWFTVELQSRARNGSSAGYCWCVIKSLQKITGALATRSSVIRHPSPILLNYSTSAHSLTSQHGLFCTLKHSSRTRVLSPFSKPSRQPRKVRPDLRRNWKIRRRRRRRKKKSVGNER